MRENPGSSIFTWLLLAGGAYLLYEWWKGQGTSVSVVSPGLPTGTTQQTNIGLPGTINTSTGGTTVGSSNPQPVASLTSPLGQAALLAMQQAAVKSFGKNVPVNASGFQWDYTAGIAFGTQRIPLNRLGLDGNNQMTIQQYTQAYLNASVQQIPSNAGFAGLGCCNSYGMGSVSNTDLFYNKMANRKGWAVGDFNTPHAGKNQGWLN